MADRLISVPAARAHIEVAVADPILKACMHNVLDGVPAADAVPVVRCKDCKCSKIPHNPKMVGKYVNCALYDPTPLMRCEDFCSYGERRNDG